MGGVPDIKIPPLMKDTPRRLCVGVFGFSEKAYLYGHDLFFLVVEYRVQRFGELVEQLLRLGFTVFRLVFGHAFLLGLLKASTASRRALRKLMRAVSASWRTCLTSSLRRSSVRGGIDSRICSPLFEGVSPMLESMIAFSIARIRFLSQGWIRMVLASGTVTLATPEIGV